MAEAIGSYETFAPMHDRYGTLHAPAHVKRLTTQLGTSLPPSPRTSP